MALRSADEGLGQCQLVFHLLHPSHRSHEPQIGTNEGASRDRSAHIRPRRELRRVDSIVDLRDAPRRDADRSPQISSEVSRQRDIVADERSVEAANPTILAVRSVEIADVATVFAVHAYRDTREPCRDRRLQRGQVARVHDRRRKFAEKSEQARVEPHAVARFLVQREVLDVAASDSSSEIGDVGERNDRVPICLGGQMADEIDDAVLESADIEP